MKVNSKISISLFLYLVTIICFTYFSNTIQFVDSHEYITSTKEFAGISNVNVFQTHSLITQFVSAQFIKLFPSLFLMKLLGSIWLFFIGVLLYLYTKNENTLYVWIFSPIAWILSIQVNPIMPAAFFVLLSYILFKKYESSQSYLYLISSGLSAGISIIVYYSSFIIITLFLLVFMYNKEFSKVLVYLAALLVAIIPELVINYLFFDNAFYSIIRYLGANYVVSLAQASKGQLLHWYWLLIPIGFTPLLYKIFKLNFKRYKREIVLLGLCLIAYGVRGMEFKYMFIFAPLIILLASNKLTKKELIINTIFSLVLISILTYSYFTSDYDSKVINDLNSIKKEYPSSQYIVSGYYATTLASFSWSNSPKFIWAYEYLFEKNNLTDTSNYTFMTFPKINSDKILVLNFRLIKANKIVFNEPVYFISVNNEPVPEEFKLLKKYDILTIYKKY